MSEPKKLSKEQYFQWVYEMEKMIHQRTKHAHSLSKVTIAEQEVEKKQLEVTIARMQSESVLSDTGKAEHTYQEFLKALELEIDHPVKDCAINPITLEITKL